MDYDSWCYTHTHTCPHSHTLYRVRQGKEHSLIIAAVQRQSENAFAVTMVLLAASLEHRTSLVVTQRPTGKSRA